ncbi:MAG: ribosome maturation factor RimP [Candidatus Omnitrophota bacterium]|nr:ribosome maturation factor RimP [Candidatus Omnitrophota bacterium]
MEITDRVRQVAEHHLDGRDIEVVDVIYRREQPGMVLRILIDKPEGVTIAECEELNNFLSIELDNQDVIQERYVLEISSPGLDRPIKTDRDFERSMGKLLEITTYERIDDKKAHEGTLMGMDKENIVVESDGISTVIPRNKIALARLKIEI